MPDRSMYHTLVRRGMPKEQAAVEAGFPIGTIPPTPDEIYRESVAAARQQQIEADAKAAEAAAKRKAQTAKQTRAAKPSKASKQSSKKDDSGK